MIRIIIIIMNTNIEQFNTCSLPWRRYTINLHKGLQNYFYRLDIIGFTYVICRTVRCRYQNFCRCRYLKIMFCRCRCRYLKSADADADTLKTNMLKNEMYIILHVNKHKNWFIGIVYVFVYCIYYTYANITYVCTLYII